MGGWAGPVDSGGVPGPGHVMITSMPHFTAYDGTRLHYDVSGDGPALVALAGGPGMDARYLGTLGGLDGHRTLITLHARATGRSEVPADPAGCSFAAQARDVDGLVRELGLDRPDVLAHSAGALTAQRYAADAPDRVGRLVLVAPVGRAAREPDDAEVAAIRAARAGEDWYPQAAAADAKLRAGAEPTAELLAELVPFYWGSWSEAAHRAVAQPLTAPQPWIRQAFYASSGRPVPLARTPVLVVAGGLDGMIGTTPARLTAECHPRARLEILDNCGHRPWVEAPERFRRLVLGFLDR